MNPTLDVAPDRLRIREGGGCLAAFGLPFFGAGVFLFLIVAGVVPLGNAGTLPVYGWPLLGLMAVAFTAVGGGLAFGRSWTTIDRGQGSVRRQWGLLVPMREQVQSCHGASAVSLGLIQGDSDTADRYPVGLKAADGSDLRLCDFTDYGQARACAGAVAQHLALDLADASSDHAVRLPASHVDLSFRDRARPLPRTGDAVTPPSGGRCQVHREADGTVIVIPSARMHPLSGLAALLPVAVLLLLGPSLADFFRQTRTPDPVAWVFLGFMTLVLGVMPVMTAINALRRSARGATIVNVSRRGIQVHERGAWRTRTTASLDAAAILDVDFSVRESALAATRRATEREVRRLGRAPDAVVGRRVERLLGVLGRLVTARGIVVKTRSGIVTVGEGLHDDEIRYLHAVVRRALVE